MLTEFDIPLYKAEHAKVLYTEDGVMHTVRIDHQTFKGLWTGSGWKITEMK